MHNPVECDKFVRMKSMKKKHGVPTKFHQGIFVEFFSKNFTNYSPWKLLFRCHCVRNVWPHILRIKIPFQFSLLMCSWQMWTSVVRCVNWVRPNCLDKILYISHRSSLEMFINQFRSICANWFWVYCVPANDFANFVGHFECEYDWSILICVFRSGATRT